MGELVSIVYKPAEAPTSGAGYTRISIQEGNLIAGHGIEGDTKGGGKDRHVNIMTQETLQALATEGFTTEPGAMGEQLIVSGLDVNGLAAGARLQIGETACVEIGVPRTGCGIFERHQEKSPQLAAGRLGMMAQVITSGSIRIGDNVKEIK